MYDGIRIYTLLLNCVASYREDPQIPDLKIGNELSQWALNTSDELVNYLYSQQVPLPF